MRAFISPKSLTITFSKCFGRFERMKSIIFSLPVFFLVYLIVTIRATPPVTRSAVHWRLYVSEVRPLRKQFFIFNLLFLKSFKVSHHTRRYLGMYRLSPFEESFGKKKYSVRLFERLIFVKFQCFLRKPKINIKSLRGFRSNSDNPLTLEERSPPRFYTFSFFFLLEHIFFLKT